VLLLQLDSARRGFLRASWRASSSLSLLSDM
jgi:hypothetical protein